ncbi:hypothetical protein RGAI101_2898 [Roseobacter sp. GAI101]|nr:hypothetical protein RGAI101_2898 [Roseobacter sp. GAI101]
MPRRLAEAVGGTPHLKKSSTVEKLKLFIRFRGMFGNDQFMGLIIVTAHVGNRKLNFMNDGFLRHDLPCFRRLGCLMRLAAL